MSRSQLHWKAALALYLKGWTYSAIARHYGCHYTTVSLRLRALGAKTYSSPAWDSVKGRSLYRVWTSTRARCRNPKDAAFHRNGGRGIKVSPVWNRFRPFYEWAIRTGYRRGRRLVLIDQDRDFAPENCRWSERGDKRPRERRPNASADRVRAFGEVKTVGAWARDRRCKVSRPTLRERLLEGVPPEVAMRSPARSKWDPPLPKSKKPVITSRTYAVTDWDMAIRLRVKQRMSMKDIAARLGVSYQTIQAGLRQRLGRTTQRPPMSHDRRRLYQIWRSLRLRRVRVCREWGEFEGFQSWAVRAGWKPRLCLARIKPRRPYSPTNSEWITRGDMSVRLAREVWARRKASR